MDMSVIATREIAVVKANFCTEAELQAQLAPGMTILRKKVFAYRPSWEPTTFGIFYADNGDSNIFDHAEGEYAVFGFSETDADAGPIPKVERFAPWDQPENVVERNGYLHDAYLVISEEIRQWHPGNYASEFSH